MNDDVPSSVYGLVETIRDRQFVMLATVGILALLIAVQIAVKVWAVRCVRGILTRSVTQQERVERLLAMAEAHGVLTEHQQARMTRAAESTTAAVKTTAADVSSLIREVPAKTAAAVVDTMSDASGLARTPSAEPPTPKE